MATNCRWRGRLLPLLPPWDGLRRHHRCSATALFVVAFVASPTHGLLGHRLRRHPQHAGASPTVDPPTGTSTADWPVCNAGLSSQSTSPTGGVP